MARGINKVILIGNLGNDPDTRFSAQGSAITNISLATDESYKDRNTGQIVPKTEWHRVVLFNRLAEIAKEYLKKGSKVYIEGRLQTRKWQDQAGQDRYTTEIVANDLQMLDSRGEASAQGQGYPMTQGGQAPAGNNPQGGAQAAPQQNRPAAAPQPAPQAAPPAAGHPAMEPTPLPDPMSGLDDMDDDIPF